MIRPSYNDFLHLPVNSKKADQMISLFFIKDLHLKGSVGHHKSDRPLPGIHDHSLSQ
jgi:hypothetical protein